MEHLPKQIDDRGDIVTNEEELVRIDSSISPSILNDERLVLNELTVRNYDNGCSHSSLVSCYTTEENYLNGRYLHQLRAHQPNSIIEYRDLQRRRFHELKPLPSRQNDRDSSRISSHLTNGHSEKSSSTLPLRYDRSKASSSPNSSQFSCRQLSRKGLDMMVNTNSPFNQVHSQENAEKGLELPHAGATLREWLNSGGLKKNRSYRMRLFKQVVQIVDIAHSQGFALLDIRPSSFILLPPDEIRVRYIGSSMQVEFPGMVEQNTTKRRLEHENNFTHAGSSAEGQFGLVFDQLEKKWYTHPQELGNIDLQSRSTVLAFCYLSPKEAAFCFRLLHPIPSSRPTTWEILNSEIIYGLEETTLGGAEASFSNKVDDAELDLLLYFLFALKEEKQNKTSKLLENIEFLEADIKEVEGRYAFRRSSDRIDGDEDTRQKHSITDIDSKTNLFGPRLTSNISAIEDAYFCMRSQVHIPEISETERSDRDMLRSRDKLSWVQSQHKKPTMEDKSIDRVGAFFEDICKFAHYTGFEVCGTLRNGDILNSSNVICSLSFDHEEKYIATAGVSKKIKIFEFNSLLNDSVDIQYPVIEMPNKSKFSCVSWNNYIKNYLASADYDGIVQVWDARTGQGLTQYMEHQKRAWSVDFSQLDPMKFASGSDDCSIRLWSINEKNSTGTIRNSANICCVQFSCFSSHLLAFGSADYKISCYDLRHTRIPWCTLAGHGKAVSYVKFMDPSSLVSASTDSTLKLWDLKKTCLDGVSPGACSLTFSGHANEKNFVGLSVFDGYIACGSETNEVYAYYKSFPMPITRHTFGSIDPISGHEISNSNGQFVSSVCWRRKSNMVIAANSSGSIKILRLLNVNTNSAEYSTNQTMPFLVSQTIFPKTHTVRASKQLEYIMQSFITEESALGKHVLNKRVVEKLAEYAEKK